MKTVVMLLMSMFIFDAIAASLFGAIRHGGGESRLLLLQTLAVVHNAFANGAGHLFAIILAFDLSDVFLVREETALHQDGGIPHIGDDKELFSFCSPIRGLRSHDERILN